MYVDIVVSSKVSIWYEVFRIVNEEGFRVFWKGNLVIIIYRFLYFFVNFYLYEYYKKVGRVYNLIVYVKWL